MLVKYIHMKKNKLLIDQDSMINQDRINNIKYYEPLPKELERWYVYTKKYGHSIVILLKEFEEKIEKDAQRSANDFLMVCPVKTVLRGYSINKTGVVVITGLGYCNTTGLIFPSHDIEHDNFLNPETLEKEKNQRQQIIMFVAQHCAYVRLIKYGNVEIKELMQFENLVYYSLFKNFVGKHIDIANSVAELNSYVDELKFLLDWYDEKAIGDIDHVFVSDNACEIFSDVYNEILKNGTINKKLKL